MPTCSHDRPHFNAAVFVVLKNEQGEYLLQQRQNTTYMNGYWDCSGSGHVEHGETLQTSAVRELEEEAGVKVAEASLRLVHILQHDVGDWPYFDFIFVANTYEGEAMIAEKEKVADLQWFAPDSFPEKLTLAMHMFRKADFPDKELTFSYVNEDDHYHITGQKYERD